MSAPSKRTVFARREVAPVIRPKWQEIRPGLLLAVVGHALLLGLALPGLLLAGPLNGRAASLLRREPSGAGALGLALLGAGALAGYALVLAGQWRCQRYAPPGDRTRELQSACLFCSLTAPPCFVVAYFLGGAETYAALARDPGSLREINLLNRAGLLHVTGLVVGLLSVLFFSGFAGTVARHLGDEERVRSAKAYFWYVAFMLGGTAGMLLEARNAPRLDGWAVLAVGWFVSLPWHALVVLRACRSIASAAESQKAAERPSPSPWSWQQSRANVPVVSPFRRAGAAS